MAWLIALGVIVALGAGAGFAWREYARRHVVVWAWQQGLLYRDGAFERVLPPGRHFRGFGTARIEAIAIAAQQTLVPLQEVLTAEGFSVKLGAVAEWIVTDPRRFHEATVGQLRDERLRIAVQMALRHAARTRSVDALLADRDTLAEELLPAVAAVGAAMGVSVTAVALRDVALSAELRRLITDVERAKREGLAALERARGEQASLRSLANAARLLKGNPELAQLRVLQALQTGPGKVPPTLVLGGGGLLPLRSAEAEPEAEPQG